MARVRSHSPDVWKEDEEGTRWQEGQTEAETISLS